MTGKGFRVCRSQDQGSCAPSLLQSIVAFHVWGQRPHPIPPSRTTHCGPLPSYIAGVAVFCEAGGSWGRSRGAECVAQLHPSFISYWRSLTTFHHPQSDHSSRLRAFTRSQGVTVFATLGAFGLTHPMHPLHNTHHNKPVGFNPETV